MPDESYAVWYLNAIQICRKKIIIYSENKGCFIFLQCSLLNNAHCFVRFLAFHEKTEHLNSYTATISLGLVYL